ncbi:phage tail protein, partial [Clostridium botulinum]|uniref:phage tail protein n=1 Tax=Clostridium botulinum TaxID=1491 RepID=UPI00178C8EDE
MAEKFYTILTKVGKAKIANATALGNKVNFTTLKVGDGGGKYYNPTEEQEDLVNEVWQGNINSIRVDENNPNWVVIEVIIPSSVGGFMIREAGVFDDENNMLAIGKYPETYKPQAQDGSTKDLVIRTNLEISNTSSVTLKVDPTVILATQKDIQILENKIKNIKIPVTKVNEKTGDVVLTASDIKTENGQTVEVQLADITTEHNENTEQINTSIEEIEKKITNYNSYASGKDSKGVYTIIEYKNK